MSFAELVTGQGWFIAFRAKSGREICLDAGLEFWMLHTIFPHRFFVLSAYSQAAFIAVDVTVLCGFATIQATMLPLAFGAACTSMFIASGVPLFSLVFRHERLLLLIPLAPLFHAFRTKRMPACGFALLANDADSVRLVPLIGHLLLLAVIVFLRHGAPPQKKLTA